MAAKGWTEAEKLGVLFQIIEQGGSIPWDKITIPEGRTQKAVTVMIDREKKKVRDAKKKEEGGEDGQTGDGDGDGEGQATPKAKAAPKRKTNGDGGTTPKKPKTPRKKKETVKAGSDEEEATKEGGEEDAVKAEPEEEDTF